MVKHCSYGDCNSNTRYPVKGVTFHHFPGKKHQPGRSAKWIHACGRSDGRLEKAKSLDNKYICSLHFSGGNGPTREHPDPIPKNASSYKKQMLYNPRRTLVRKPLSGDKVSSSLEIQPAVTEEPLIGGNLPSCSNQTCRQTSSFADGQHLKDVTMCYSIFTASNSTNAKPIQSLLIDTPETGLTNNHIFIISLSQAHFLKVMDLQWSVMAQNKIVSYFYIQDSLVQKSLTVDRQTGMFKIAVFGKEFDSTKDANFLQPVKDEYDIMNIITNLETMKLCEGIQDSLANVIESILKQHFAPQCKFITTTAKKSRCKTCQDRRSYLMRKCKTVKLKTSHCHITKLNKTHLVAFAQAQRRRMKLYKRRIQRMKISEKAYF